jgi:hypothetical protein
MDRTASDRSMLKFAKRLAGCAALYRWERRLGRPKWVNRSSRAPCGIPIFAPRQVTDLWTTERIQ